MIKIIIFYSHSLSFFLFLTVFLLIFSIQSLPYYRFYSFLFFFPFSFFIPFSLFSLFLILFRFSFSFFLALEVYKRLMGSVFLGGRGRNQNSRALFSFKNSYFFCSFLLLFFSFFLFLPFFLLPSFYISIIFLLAFPLFSLS